MLRSRISSWPEKDPDYAPAHVGIGGVWNFRRQMGGVPAHEATPLQKAAVLRALQLDESLAETHDGLAALKLWGEWDWSSAERAFQRAKQTLGLPQLEPQPPETVGLKQLAIALSELSELTPQLKRRLLTASAEYISADHEILVAEAELFRAIADTLDCPVPPLLPGQPLA